VGGFECVEGACIPRGIGIASDDPSSLTPDSGAPPGTGSSTPVIIIICPTAMFWTVPASIPFASAHCVCACMPPNTLSISISYNTPSSLSLRRFSFFLCLLRLRSFLPTFVLTSWGRRPRYFEAFSRRCFFRHSMR
jgi:hypothetical protein